MAPQNSLSQEEIDQLRATFLLFDADGSGSIENWELKEMLIQMGQDPSDEEVFNLIATIDADASGGIGFGEFLQIVLTQKDSAGGEGEDSDIIDAWVAVGGDLPDPKNPKASPTGIVDTNLLIKVIKQDFGLPCEIETLIEAIDLDGSGTVDFFEFKQLLSS